MRSRGAVRTGILNRVADHRHQGSHEEAAGLGSSDR